MVSVALGCLFSNLIVCNSIVPCNCSTAHRKSVNRFGQYLLEVPLFLESEGGIPFYLCETEVSFRIIVWLRIQFGACSTTQSSEVEIDRVNYLNNWLLTFVSAVVPSDLRTRCLLWLKKGRSAVRFFCFVSAFSLRTRSVLIVRVGSAFLLTANWVLRLFRMKLRETTSTHC